MSVHEPGAGPAPAPEWSLGTRTSPEVGCRRRVLLVPLGSTEQHGPHLPLDTDTRLATALCERVAADSARTGGGIDVAPPVAYGASGEHDGFPGTLSIGQDGLATVVVELGRSAGDDFSLIVFVNGHGGNAEALARAVATLVAEGRAVVAWSPSSPGGDSHAGRVETSALLAVSPEVVRLDRAEPGVTDPLDEIIAGLREGGLRSVTRNGVLGDPTGASAREGEQLMAGWTRGLAEVVAGHMASAARP